MRIRNLMVAGTVLLAGATVAPAIPPVTAQQGRPESTAGPESGAAERLTAATAGNQEHVAAQLANVGRLLETSSGARRVRESGNELAQKIHQHARERYAGAERAYRDADYTQADQLLVEATQTMFQAIRILGPPSASVQKRVDDFEGRAETTRALLDALQRIAQEEGAESAAARTVRTVEQTVGAARIFLANGNHVDARRLLDGAYEIAKAAVEELRDGKTLVRSLRFETEEQEYHYEVDRNDTHHMLVRVLIEEKHPGPQMRARVDEFVQHAGELRRQAEARAAGGAWRNAIDLLEQSTKELVRAIRSAGLYIPG